ncbi:sugar ABC transporter substrate-binding protein [Heliophilum fasciatum]|uniref:Monosaccharide ABC transporter substrate-binding protein (CUT2 family) n=1 Tax=Heliophilum fasciatum TaxID=35700 RepID=A0A4R2RKR4_9FIRM|nr:sugar ABC transporter substrate-binding protein [Heliophilum fasciatum]MCW2278398.1 ribose transport system substrate-binding protein [Heliophilum fasciatum]TCP63703.1 monosaccharide ABC transporter substrate-binding protein (CUT2 family) [Heliophilum fasciatum]
MSMKKSLLGVLLLLMMVMLSACGGSTAAKTNPLIADDGGTKKQPENQDLKPKKNIALVMKTLTNPFFIEMEKGARRAESELGINLIVKVGAKETSIEQQIAIVEELTRDKIDAIVIAPGSSTELIPALKKAKDANIPIINIDNRLDPKLSQEMGLGQIPFISVNNEQGAYLAAKVLSDKIKKPTQAVIIEGIPGTDNGEQRRRGAQRAFSENPNIQLVASQSAMWKIDEAMELTGKFFQRYPNIGVIFCANDMMALGALQYLEQTGKKDVLVAGYDALEEAKKAIQTGKLLATIDQQADVQGYTGVKYAMSAIQGNAVPVETMVDVKLLQADNLP